MRDYIDIKKELAPYKFNILLGSEWFEMSIAYNKLGDMFTVSLYKDGALIATEPLILGAPLFKEVYQPNRFPSISLVPYGTSERKVTFENLGKTVFLTIDNEGEDADG